MRSRMKDVMDDAQDTMGLDNAGDVMSTARSMLRDTVDAVADRTSAARDWASQTADAARQAPSQLADAGAGYIKASPFLAIGLAAAVGYMIGRAAR